MSYEYRLATANKYYRVFTFVRADDDDDLKGSCSCFYLAKRNLHSLSGVRKSKLHFSQRLFIVI